MTSSLRAVARQPTAHGKQAPGAEIINYKYKLIPWEIFCRKLVCKNVVIKKKNFVSRLNGFTINNITKV